MDDKKYARRREEMVRLQIEARGISDPLVLQALRKVPRHIFVPDALSEQAYGDHPLPIGDQQTISQPYIVAEMTQNLELTKTDRVLEIGTGSGYQAAILAEIVFRVYSIERKRSLYDTTRKLFDTLGYFNIVTRYGDGTSGWREESPFDAIMVTAGAPKIPDVLIDQLADGGRLVIPVGDQHSQILTKIKKQKQTIQQVPLGGCRFVKLIGEHGWPV
ncbi:MAG: protein-L-isoaspartate(D-aspartate) O-methyltransferase [Desulfobacterales bacterium]|nr:protein-L-isoaspartate(D-aspartate) O-methyltransferase [Desulfobacterales bacterium]